MKINHFDRSTIRYIDAELQKKLDELGDELGLDIKILNGSFDTATYTPRLEMKLLDASGQVKHDPYFLSMCSQNGLDHNLISHDGYKLVGYRPSRPKFPWDVIHSRTGKQAKAPRAWVNARFKSTSPGAIPTIASQIKPPAPPTQPSNPARNYAGQF